MKTSVTFRLIIFTAMICLAYRAGAVSTYLTNAEKQYPNIVGSKLDNCTLCHTSAPTRNPYGAAFGSASHSFTAIESLDSDGDGFTNIAEIKALTYPGNATDHPVVVAVPALGSVSPVSGTTAGGTPVTLAGTGLAGASVSFGGTAATGVVVNAGGTQITAVTPAHAAGAVSLTVTTTGGTSGAVTFTYVAPSAPTLNSITPTSGTTAGGTSVTLAGANLTGASVSFSGTLATSVVANPTGTQITAITPAHAAGAVSVTVTTTGGTSSAVTYTYVTPTSSAPTLTSISPASGSSAGGTSVTLTGTNLTGASVTFSGTPATSAVVDPTGTQITAITPAHATGAVSVTATTANGNSGALTYTYVPPSPTAPTLASISPTSGAADGGTPVTLTGTNLAGASLIFGSMPALSVVVDPTGTQITAVTPAHVPGAVSVTAYTTNGNSDTVTYTYLPPTPPAPVLHLIQPTSGTASGGTSVTLLGTNLTGASVSFGGTAATSAVVDAIGTQITAVTPAHAAGVVSVTVTTTGGTSGAVTYTYVPPSPLAPTLNSIAPTSGTTAGGTAVTLTGTNLTGASVSFSGTAASGVVVDATGTQITAVTPAHAAGAVGVTVTTANGTSGAVTYTCTAPPPPAPTLISIAPTSGTTAGGTSVALTGTNLTGASVSFSGTAGSGIVVNANGTQLTAVTPAHAAGVASVTVTTAGGTSGAVTYTYVTPPPSAPTLSSIAPTSGTTAGGTAVTLIGTNLTGASVLFSGTGATGVVVNAGGTQITAVTPAHAAGAVSVTVSTTGGTSGAVTYTYITPSLSAPTLTTMSPTSGSAAGGTLVTLTGTNLAGAKVYFGGTAATVSGTPQATRITVQAPAHVVAMAGVRVVTANGTSNPLYFTYGALVPALTSLSTTHGTAAGGESVLLYGSNLLGGTVSFGGAAASVTAGSATQITARTPSHASGRVSVTVHTAAGTSNGLTYTYDSAHDDTSSTLQLSETVLPAPVADAPNATIPSNSVLSVRVTNATPIDPASVSAVLTSSAGIDKGGVWRPTTPGDDTDGWVMFAPNRALPAGATVTLTVSARTADGKPIAPITEQFNIAAQGQQQQAPDSPILEDAAGVAPLADAANVPNAALYQLKPVEVFSDPVTLQVPVPQGSDPGSLNVYYQSLNLAHQGWHLGQNVAGWIVPNSQRVVQTGTETFIEIQVNHAGIVTLGKVGNK